jgi:pyruvate-formate lyase-activating enzyme
VGLDIKAPLDERYGRLTGDRHSAARVRESLELMRRADAAFQLRTTVGPGEECQPDFADLCRQLQSLGLPPPVRQEMRTPGTARRNGETAARSAIAPSYSLRQVR